MTPRDDRPSDGVLRAGARSPTHAVLIVPGLGNSGPGHWQTLWENANPGYRRVFQRDWDDPDLAEWARAVDRAVRESHLPCLLVAHSFGCLAVVQRALHCDDGIAGALLVAPADPDRWHVAWDAIVGRAFGFPSIVVASETDPWLDIDKARDFAAQWGSRFVNAGAAGHINVDAGYGHWTDGEWLLGALHAAADPCRSPWRSEDDISRQHVPPRHASETICDCIARLPAETSGNLRRVDSTRVAGRFLTAISRASFSQCSPPTVASPGMRGWFGAGMREVLSCRHSPSAGLQCYCL